MTPLPSLPPWVETLPRAGAVFPAGGIAVGAHTTRFAIREHGLHEPVICAA